MQPVLTRLQTRRLDVDRFEAPPIPVMIGTRLFGGQVVAQSLDAAYSTVEDRVCHSLHGYFVRAGDPARPLRFEVERIRDGGSFATRRVTARQEEKEIFVLLASFHGVESGPSHQEPMPDAPPPSEILLLHVPRSPASGPAAIVDMLQVDPRPDPRSVMPPRKSVWIRAGDCMGAQLDRHHVALAFASDMNLLETAMRPHGLFWSTEGLLATSLDHAVWFHRPFDFSQWLLFVQDSPTAHGGRCFVRGAVYAANGDHVATVAQEGLLRMREAADRR